jgi:7,8-dihydropterin-6-yl-methyl-4-(beta-D-ribofuranosyl)aminobenzene 5'-phosphate synthase
MIALEPLDKVEVQILVDNVTDNLSSVPAFVETEFAALGRRRRGKWVLAGRCLCCAAHGLSCLITAHRGTQKRTILFDTGPEDRTFEQNVSRLDADLAPVETIVLSHGHWDHAGAVLRALDLIRDRNGGREIPYYAHPDMFRTRALKLPSGTMVPMQDVPSIDELTAHGARVVNTTEPQLILDNLAYVSGEIPRVTPFEHGFPEQHRKTADGWEPDPLTRDERFWQ